MEKIIFEIERQIQRLQAAKQFLIETHDSGSSVEALNAHLASISGAPVKRGRGRPRKHPLVVPMGARDETSAA